MLTYSLNETIATKQEFFLTKVAPAQSITNIVLLVFLLIMFISSYTTIYFFVKNYFSRISANTIFACSYLSFGWEIGHPLRTWLEEWSDPRCVQVHTEGEGYHASCVNLHLHYLFLCFCLMVSCFICRILTLSSFKKGALVTNYYFSPMTSFSIVMK